MNGKILGAAAAAVLAAGCSMNQTTLKPENGQELNRKYFKITNAKYIGATNIDGETKYFVKAFAVSPREYTDFEKSDVEFGYRSDARMKDFLGTQGDTKGSGKHKPEKVTYLARELKISGADEVVLGLYFEDIASANKWATNMQDSTMSMFIPEGSSDDVTVKKAGDDTFISVVNPKNHLFWMDEVDSKYLSEQFEGYKQHPKAKSLFDELTGIEMNDDGTFKSSNYGALKKAKTVLPDEAPVNTGSGSSTGGNTETGSQ